MRVSRIGVVAFGLGIAVVGVGGGLAACSSTSNGGGGPNNNSNAPTTCATQALEVVFDPMYSAYDGTHEFQVPAIVNGIASGTINWSASDPTMVKFAPDTDTGGVMITVQSAMGTGGSNTVNIIAYVASAPSVCGSSVLTITSATPDDWQIGNARYNDGNALHFGRGGPGGGPSDGGASITDGGGGPACTNCHGPTSDGGPFMDIAHTPQQTGGFSDQDLINIVVNGIVPDGGYFDPTIVSYQAWQSFHKWSDITQDEQPGIVTYLRSLTPTSQNGSADFGGHGFGDGGMHHHDGGGFGGGDGGGGGGDSGGGGGTDAGAGGD